MKLFLVALFIFIILLCLNISVFNYVFPPHIRSLVLMLLGSWLWCLNYFALLKLGIDMTTLLAVPEDNKEVLHVVSHSGTQIADSRLEASPLSARTNEMSGTPPLQKYRRQKNREGMLRLIQFMSILLIFILFLFHFYMGEYLSPADSKPSADSANPFLPQSKEDEYTGNSESYSVHMFLSICFVAPVIVMILPFNLLYRRERWQFWLAVRRITIGTFDRPTFFADVLFADMLTSYSKALGDIVVACCSIMFEPTENIFSSRLCSSSIAVHLAVG